MSKRRNKPPAPPARKEPLFKIAVSLACMDTVEAGFCYDLAKMSAYSGMALIATDIAEIRYNMLSSSILSASRNDLAVEAMKSGATHVLCIDSDMRFPKDALVRLLRHNKDFVGINYATRKPPPGYVAFKHKGWTNEEHVRLETTPTSTGLEEVEALGFGLVLIKTDVFRQIPYPGFETWYDPKTTMWIGEDVDFCVKATNAGIKIYVDHDLSKECAHIGRLEYTLAMIEATKDMDAGLITPEVQDVDPVQPKLILEA